MKELENKSHDRESIRHLPQHYEALRMPLSFDAVFILQARERTKTMAGYVKAYREAYGEEKGKSLALQTLHNIWREAFTEFIESGSIEIRPGQMRDFITYVLQGDDAGGFLQFHICEIKHFFRWMGERKIYGKLDYFKLIDAAKNYRADREAVADDRSFDLHRQIRASEGADINSPELAEGLSNLFAKWDNRNRNPENKGRLRPRRKPETFKDVADALELTLDELGERANHICSSLLAGGNLGTPHGWDDEQWASKMTTELLFNEASFKILSP